MLFRLLLLIHGFSINGKKLRIFMKTKIQSWLTVFLSVVVGIFICESIQAQDQYRGLGAQRDPVLGNGGGGSGFSAAQQAQNIADAKARDAEARAEAQGRKDAAIAANNKGLDAYKNGDWATAIADFTQALQNTPDDTVIQNNLVIAQKNLKTEKDNKIAWDKKIAEDNRIAEDKRKSAINNLQEVVQNFTRNLNNSTAPSSGLDFMSADSGAKSELHDAVASPQPKPALEFGDPMVVDARDVPTGLPKSVVDSIPHTPAGDRVRKGFEAIQTHDWKVALAWFQDALNHEPGDPGLQRLVDLAQFTLALPIQAQIPPDLNNSTPPQTAPLPDQNSTIKSEYDKTSQPIWVGEVKAYMLHHHNVEPSVNVQGHADPFWTQFYNALIDLATVSPSDAPRGWDKMTPEEQDRWLSHTPHG
jgi:tetratricopeptide (TPR) repeat protein